MLSAPQLRECAPPVRWQAFETYHSHKIKFYFCKICLQITQRLRHTHTHTHTYNTLTNCPACDYRCANRQVQSATYSWHQVIYYMKYAVLPFKQLSQRKLSRQGRHNAIITSGTKSNTHAGAVISLRHVICRRLTATRSSRCLGPSINYGRESSNLSWKRGWSFVRGSK